MFKKIILLILVCVCAFFGTDYLKHYLLLREVKAFCIAENISYKDADIVWEKYKFRLHVHSASKGEYATKFIDLRIPFDHFFRLRIKGKDLTAPYTHARFAYVIATKKGETVDIEYYKMEDIRLTPSSREYFTKDISGSALFKEDHLTYTLYSDDFMYENDTMFRLASHGVMDNVTSPEERRGEISLRISYLGNALALLSHEGVITSFQQSLMQQILGKNTQISFDIKGKKIFLGPLKIFEMK